MLNFILGNIIVDDRENVPKTPKFSDRSGFTNRLFTQPSPKIPKQRKDHRYEVVRQRLPIWNYRMFILDTIRNNAVTFIKGNNFCNTSKYKLTDSILYRRYWLWENYTGTTIINNLNTSIITGNLCFLNRSHNFFWMMLQLIDKASELFVQCQEELRL
jgi:hypothetical protein